MPPPTVVLDRDDMRRTLVRIAHEIVEKNPESGPDDRSRAGAYGGPDDRSRAGAHGGPDERARGGAHGPIALVGIQRRGAILAQRLHALTSELLSTQVPLGFVDISFYRDDLAIRAGGSASPVVHATQLDFAVDRRTIVIVDDVLYTGRTARAAIDVIFDYGRPARVQLAALVDRGHRELPIRPDYVGKNLPTSKDQRVNVCVEEIDGEDEVTIGPAGEPRRAAA
jgi:pyrimidine operon attenuation protein / uracil phosphoribosyltransferase